HARDDRAGLRGSARRRVRPRATPAVRRRAQQGDEPPHAARRAGASVTAMIRDLLGYADRAARDGDVGTARATFVDAAEKASAQGPWRTAVRCYRRVLELDLTDREVVDRIVLVSARLATGVDWIDYARALEAHRTWPRFGALAAQVVLGDLGGVVTCARVGPV